VTYKEADAHERREREERAFADDTRGRDRHRDDRDRDQREDERDEPGGGHRLRPALREYGREAPDREADRERCEHRDEHDLRDGEHRDAPAEERDGHGYEDDG